MPRIDLLPLALLPAQEQAAIAAAVAQATPPAKWQDLGLGQIRNRAYTEWCIARGVDPYGVRRRIPAELRAQVYERDGHSCVRCGADHDLTLDHIHPYLLGGPDTLENLRTLCRPCNSRKGMRLDG